MIRACVMREKGREKTISESAEEANERRYEEAEICDDDDDDNRVN